MQLNCAGFNAVSVYMPWNWDLGPQRSLWLPLDWLRPRNELVLFEEIRVRPELLCVSLAGFGPQATIRLPTDE